MKRCIVILFFILLIPVSCSKEIREAAPPPVNEDVNTLEEFFIRSDNDIRKAMEVIENHRIIQHLTHLRRMNSGGRRYYLLERDNITEMINAVTEGIYLDYILINRHGHIVYSRSNDYLFGIDISSGYDNSPLKRCFSSTGRETYFDDVSSSGPGADFKSLYVSRPVYVQGNYHGVVILQVDINKIAELLQEDTDVISREGIIRVASDSSRILSRYSYYSSIPHDRERGFFRQGSGTVYYYPFTFSNISWIVLTRGT